MTAYLTVEKSEAKFIFSVVHDVKPKLGPCRERLGTIVQVVALNEYESRLPLDELCSLLNRWPGIERRHHGCA